MKLRSGRQPNANESQENRHTQRDQGGKNPDTQVARPIPNLQPNDDDDAQSQFDKLYSDLAQPGSFTRKIARYLRKNSTHSLHKPLRRKFPRRKIITHFPGQIVQSDLIDMQTLATRNAGFNYILVLIDCFSKKLFLEPLKSKRGEETAAALRKIFNRSPFLIQSFIADEGLEYRNQYVKNLFAEFNIHFYHIRTKLKASSAERVNKTIKSLIWKYFTQNNTKKWVPFLQDIADHYNKTYHRAIKMSPDEVTWSNRHKVFKNLYPDFHSVVKFRLREGDRVRIALNKNLFEKGYTVNWSSDIFTIIHAFQKNGVCWYRIADENGKVYPKMKYFYQLNKV